MSNRRVVITGLGTVCPLGNSVKEAWENAKSGKSGIDTISLFDAANFPVQIAGEVKNFSPESFGIDHRSIRKMARFTQFLLAASTQAVSDSGFSKENLKTQKAGVVIGNVLGGEEATFTAFDKYFNVGPSHMPPLTSPMSLPNEASANVSIFYGLQGPSITVATACASGTDALGIASDLIRLGRLDLCLAGGTEAIIDGYGVTCFNQLQALSYHYNSTPQKACRPFDKDRDGFIIGEGSAVLVLEELEHAKARGAKIYAELIGYGSSCDAHHITAPLSDGSGAALAVKDAISQAQISPSDIQYYNAHGTSTQANDSSETKMLKSVFGDYAKKLHISSTKSMTGHMIGAAGAIEALFSVKAINDNFVPPTINLENPDLESGCDLDYTPKVGLETPIEIAASASLGFGGHNACVILKKYN